jgi:hypothetical protein
MTPVLEHVGSGRPAVLVLTPDAETAVSIATALGRSDVLAATSVGRAARVTPPAIVIGPPEVIQGLIARSRLKLDGLAALVIAWVGAGPALEAVMAEVPKESARTIVATAALAATPEIESLVERYARRARRVAGTPPAASVGGMRYVGVTSGNRPTTLRRLLDDLDPPSAIVWTRTDASEETARGIVRALGYGEANAVRVARDTVAESAALVVLYDIPLDAAEMAAVVQSAPVQIVALAERGELARLPGATPLTLSGPLDRARQRVEEIRRILEAGVPAAEATWLEPLLDSYDGIEIAAAAVHLLGRERRAPAPPATSTAPRPDDRRGPPRDRGRDRGGETKNPRRPGTSGAHRGSDRR